MSFPRLSLGAVADVLFTVTGDLQIGHAGGTVALWACLPDGRALLVGAPDAPWCPDEEGAVTAAGFVVLVWPGAGDYLDGAEPAATYRCAFTLDALAATLRVADGSLP